ncbi:hypothetical protein G3S67_005295 [Escherichia coli]|nr:hypothetical protein [Escherichia coli]EFI9996935.1 hypothetical protein [Escherichia coli]
MRLSARGTVKSVKRSFTGVSILLCIPALIVNWLTSPRGTRHCINKVHL